jgi:hypothetical protein
MLRAVRRQFLIKIAIPTLFFPYTVFWACQFFVPLYFAAVPFSACCCWLLCPVGFWAGFHFLRVGVPDAREQHQMHANAAALSWRVVPIVLRSLLSFRKFKILMKFHGKFH